MFEEKRNHSWNIASSLSLAVTIPWILYKVLKAIYLQRNYSALAGKV